MKKNAFSILTVLGMMALSSSPLPGAVIYARQHPLYVNSGYAVPGPDRLFEGTLDMDADGSSEVQFSTDTLQSHLLILGETRIVGFSVQIEGGAFAALDTVPLAAGALIGADSAFAGGWWHDRSYSGLNLGGCNPLTCGGLMQEADAYIGVEFKRNGNTHYGWIHYVGFTSETPFPVTVTDINGVETTSYIYGFHAPGGWIDGWAWESEPGRPIPAGHVPEPSAFILAAVSLLALFLNRRVCR